LDLVSAAPLLCAPPNERDTMTFTLVTVILGAALLIRYSRPGPIPKRRMTWFDIPRETR